MNAPSPMTWLEFLGQDILDEWLAVDPKHFPGPNAPVDAPHSACGCNGLYVHDTAKCSAAAERIREIVATGHKVAASPDLAHMRLDPEHGDQGWHVIIPQESYCDPTLPPNTVEAR